MNGDKYELLHRKIGLLVLLTTRTVEDNSFFKSYTQKIHLLMCVREVGVCVNVGTHFFE